LIYQFDSYNNYLLEQDSAFQQDPTFAHYTQAPFFGLTKSFPNPEWYDNFYMDFLTNMGSLYLQPTTTLTLQSIFEAYFKKPYSTEPSGVQVEELYATHGPNTVDNIVDQHIINVRLPKNQVMDKTTQDVFTVFDEVRQAHTVLRVIVTPGPSEYIHGATLTDPFVFRYYIYEDRNPVELIKWSDYTGWYKRFTGIFSERSQAQSGIFAPGTLPNARYTSTYHLIG